MLAPLCLSFTTAVIAARTSCVAAVTVAAVAVVKPGRVLFEMDGVAEDVAKEAMRLAMHKLPIKCKFITKATEEAVEE